MTDGFRIFTQPALTLGRDETAGCSRCTAQCPQQFKLYLRACLSGRCHPDGSDAAVYARVSTLGKGQGPGLQLREMAEYCARRGWTVGAEAEYVEEGASGAKEKRPALDSLLVDAHRRNFDTVVVWKFDRFDRSVSHLLCALDTFQALGIEFVSLTEGVDASAPTGKMVFTVLAAPWQSWSDR